MHTLLQPRMITRLGLFAAFLLLQAFEAKAYVHTATAANTQGNVTYISSTYTSGDSSRMLQIAQRWPPNSVYNNHQVGVWYDFRVGQWAIFNEDGASMPIGASFFVLDSSTSSNVFSHVAGSTGSYLTYINNPATNGRPDMKLFVTQKYVSNPFGFGGVYNNHAIGVWYDSGAGQWTIFNQDFAPLPAGATFNIVALPASSQWIYTHVADSTNTFWNYTTLNGFGSALPDTEVFITANYAPNYIYNPHALGLFYTGSVWAIFQEDLVSITRGAGFNVWLMQVPG